VFAHRRPIGSVHSILSEFDFQDALHPQIPSTVAPGNALFFLPPRGFAVMTPQWPDDINFHLIDANSGHIRVLP
jgi:hypothetical protein